MRILVTGGTGMLGRTLCRRLDGHQTLGLGSSALDVTDARACHAALDQHRPQVVVHCAAMTAVDRCESERERAYAVNAAGSENVAKACAASGARLIAMSTDYVFSGTLDRPYHEGDATVPRTVYGESKLEGERAIRMYCQDHLIVRVAWLYGPGGPSFVHTMMRLGSQPGPPVTVVDDQIGNPTSTDAVADALLPLIDDPMTGTVHLSCEGEATWYRFAQAIFRHKGYVRELLPCTTAAYPRPAPRPANSRLEKRAMRTHQRQPMAGWAEALEHFVKEHPNG